ncbi:MAG: hypothetical protein ACRBBN_13730 [Methyloligellaceae bacterium]
MSEEIEILRGEGVRVSNKQISIGNQTIEISDINNYGVEEFDKYHLETLAKALLTIALIFFVAALLLRTVYPLIIGTCCVGFGLGRINKIKACRVVIESEKQTLSFTSSDKEKITLFASAVQTAKDFGSKLDKTDDI